MDTRQGPRKALMPAQHVVLESKGPYIFFTHWGLIWTALLFLVFAFALHRADSNLIVFAFILAIVTFFAILLTHDNAAGLSLHAGTWDTDRETGRSQFSALVRNRKGAAANRIKISLISLLGTSKSQLTQSMYKLPATPDDREIHFDLPWGSSTTNSIQPQRLIVESRYPFGLLRVWHIYRFETPVAWPLAPEPRSTPEWALPLLCSSHSLEPSQIELLPYTNQPPLRIDWKTSQRLGSLMVRAFIETRDQADQEFDKTLIVNWHSLGIPTLNPVQNDTLRLNQCAFAYELGLIASRAGLKIKVIHGLTSETLFESVNPVSTQDFMEFLGTLWQLHTQNLRDSIPSSEEDV